MHFLPSTLVITLSLLISASHGCGQSAEQAALARSTRTATDSSIAGPGKPVYNLSKPAFTIQLEDPSLVEISGLSPGKQPGELVAIADEAGEVFFLNSSNGNVLRRIPFRDRGDFEAVEYVDGVIYALKSDGEIFEINNWDKELINTKVYKTPLTKSNDLEGMCYDPSKNALLLACKEDPETNVARKVFAFDLQTKQLGQMPVYTINPAAVDSLMPLGPEDKNHAFSTSAIAMHPQRKEVYLLSTALKRMLVLDAPSGRILLVYRIDKKIIPQPEGIAFDPQGNLYISSEGKGGKGMLLRFNYNGPATSHHSKQ